MPRGTIEVVIEGRDVHEPADFYRQVNEQLMAEESWDLGVSLDALDDLLYGGIGALAAAETQRWIFRDHEAMRQALGVQATRAWIEEKLAARTGFDSEHLRRQLARLEDTGHETYFEIILEVFASHPTVELVLA